MKAILKQSILLTSLSAISMGAHAQADGFKFYALLDGGFANTSIKGTGGTSRTEFVTGGYAPNFAGMTGEKSLGSGLKGGFNVEQGFLLNNNPTTNSRFFFGPDSLANRQANLWVSGSYGTVKMGTQPNIAFKSVLLGDARFGSNYGSSLAAIVLDGGLGTVDTSALSYTSPNLSNFTIATSLVSSQKNTGATTVSSGSRASVTYAKDALSATLALYNNKTKSIPTTPDANGHVLGANYKFGAFTLKGLYAKQKTAALRSLKTTGIGVQHKIIKDLALYAQYAYVKNNDTAAVAFNFAGPTIQPGSITRGQSASTLNIGALYSFF